MTPVRKRRRFANRSSRAVAAVATFISVLASVGVGVQPAHAQSELYFYNPENHHEEKLVMVDNQGTYQRFQLYDSQGGPNGKIELVENYDLGYHVATYVNEYTPVSYYGHDSSGTTQVYDNCAAPYNGERAPDGSVSKNIHTVRPGGGTGFFYADWEQVLNGTTTYPRRLCWEVNNSRHAALLYNEKLTDAQRAQVNAFQSHMLSMRTADNNMTNAGVVGAAAFAVSFGFVASGPAGWPAAAVTAAISLFTGVGGLVYQWNQFDEQRQQSLINVRELHTLGAL